MTNVYGNLIQFILRVWALCVHMLSQLYSIDCGSLPAFCVRNPVPCPINSPIID